MDQQPRENDQNTGGLQAWGTARGTFPTKFSGKMALANRLRCVSLPTRCCLPLRRAHFEVLDLRGKLPRTRGLRLLRAEFDQLISRKRYIFRQIRSITIDHLDCSAALGSTAVPGRSQSSRRTISQWRSLATDSFAAGPYDRSQQ